MYLKTALVISLIGIIGLLQCNSTKTEPVIHQQKIIENMKVKIAYGETVLTASMYDNPTTRDLIARMPFTVELEDYANTEKIFYPERKLTSEGAPDGCKPSKGDITYYAPWGDVAIFYKNFGHASGLIGLGRIDDNGIEKLQKVGKEPVTFELVSD